jgi:hypothetical protein
MSERESVSETLLAYPKLASGKATEMEAHLGYRAVSSEMPNRRLQGAEMTHTEVIA